MNMYSSASNANALRCFSVKQNDMVERDMLTEAEFHKSRSKTIQNITKGSVPKVPQLMNINQSCDEKSGDDLPAAVVPVDMNLLTSLDFESYEQNEKQVLSVLESDLFGAGTVILPESLNSIQEEISTDIETLLLQLKKEPDNEVELQAKFTLFENILETVTVIRCTTFEFWTENKANFDSASQDICEKKIKNIDCTDNLGIQDDLAIWFVYFMTKQANKNSRLINQVLADIKSKLSLLSQELGDCPFCLETMKSEDGSNENVATLSCCHRCCRGCWDQWVRIKGNRAFCPLCNHPQFLNDITIMRDF